MIATFNDLLVRFGPAEAVVQADILGIPVPTSDDMEFEPPFDLRKDVPDDGANTLVNSEPAPTPAVVGQRALLSALKQPAAGSITFELTEGSIRMKYLWASGSVGNPPREGIVVIKIREDDLVFSPNAGSLVHVRQKTHGKEDGEATVECLARLSDSDAVDMLVLRVITSGMEKTGNVVLGSPSVVSGRPSNRIDGGEPLVSGERGEDPASRLSAEESSVLWRAARLQAESAPGSQIKR